MHCRKRFPARDDPQSSSLLNVDLANGAVPSQTVLIAAPFSRCPSSKQFLRWLADAVDHPQAAYFADDVDARLASDTMQRTAAHPEISRLRWREPDLVALRVLIKRHGLIVVHHDGFSFGVDCDREIPWLFGRGGREQGPGAREVVGR